MLRLQNEGRVPKGLPQVVKDNIEKCRAAAIAAVDVYNRPGPRFRTAQYLVLIVMAWTALFHAIFYRRGKRPWFRAKPSGAGKRVRYQKIDGEPKHWDLHECLRQFYGEDHPAERSNLEFLIGLRNKVEHRNLPELDGTLYGECQASLLNLEALITSEFGARYAMAEQLSIALQFSAIIPDEKAKATKAMLSSAAKSVAEYTERFRTALPAPLLNSMKYSFSVFLVPRVANRGSSSDSAVQFVKVDEASPDELERLSRLNVLIKDKHIPIANLDLFKPSEVAEQVEQALPHLVTVNDHTVAWRFFKVRPPHGAAKPDQTKAEYCVYDAVHEDYVYTKAWIAKLKDELCTPSRFQEITGKQPHPK